MTFELSDKEVQECKEFMTEHKDCIAVMATEGSYKFSYIFTPCGLGTCTAIRCNVCKKSRDVTDVDCW